MNSLIIKNRKNRVFLNPNNISPHLLCCICTDVFSDPVRVQCGHTFCYVCIEQWAVFKKHCPVCKQSFGNRELEKDLLAAALIDDLQVKCIHEGCSWQGIESIRGKHQRCCTFKPKMELAPQFKKNTIFEITDVDEESDSCQIEIWFEQK